MATSALLVALTLLAPPGSDSVYGAVHDAVTGAPLAGVRVETEAGEPAAVTTETGAYTVTALSSGLQSLTFRRPGYDTLQLSVTVSAGASVRVDVDLEPEPLPLPPLEVAGADQSHRDGVRETRDSFEIGFRRFAAGALGSDPLAAGDDPMLAAATEPDASAQAGFPTSMHVRGGSGDQNLVLLDGLPLYGAMHLGGAASLLNPDAIASVDLHSAVPPASYGGRLSSALDVRLQPPTKRSLQMSGAWDATAVRQLVEGSIAGGAGSLLLSGRQSYRGVFSQDGDGWLGNQFHDVLTRGSLSFRHDDVALYLLHGGDRLEFPAVLGAASQTVNGQFDELRNRFTWATSTAGAVWTHSRRSGWSVTTRLWSASSAAVINWTPAADSTRVGSELNELGLSSELVADHGSSRQKAGLELQRTETSYEVRSGASAAPFLVHSMPVILGAFVEDRRTLAGRWAVSAGLRANSVNATDFSLEPRLSIRYRLSPAVAFSAGAARIHQYVQSMRNEESLLDHAFGAELPVAVGAAGLRPAGSDQLTAELETRLGGGVSLTLDAYARRFNGLLTPAAMSAAPFAPGPAPLASGHAEGLELEAHYQGGALDARANLGLAATERDLGSTEFLPSSLRSHWAAVGVVRRFGDLSLVRLAATLTDGGPTSVLRGGVDWQSPGGLGGSGEISGTPQEIVGPLNGLRLPFYFRTDLGFSRHWPVALGSKDGLLTTTLTITNLFDRRNVLGYVDDGLGQRRALLFPSRSIVAQLGWRF